MSAQGLFSRTRITPLVPSVSPSSCCSRRRSWTSTHSSPDL
ncbi:hypothetical protein EYF80_024721 [Liparis tanakae]|uniref:Uncharacterized protein n=1 Tax=Liparis tanakae TaxID=230148 RepID=A0A4Z2HJS7_9TELE|nr:hypothetical protein EYF80_024721 [Liparis tanakae]